MRIELAKDDVRLVLTYKEWYQFRMVKYMFDNADASEYKEANIELNDPDLSDIGE